MIKEMNCINCKKEITRYSKRCKSCSVTERWKNSDFRLQVGQKISKSLTGKKQTEEHKKNNSKSHKGFIPTNLEWLINNTKTNHPLKNKKNIHSEQGLEKLRLAGKLRFGKLSFSWKGGKPKCEICQKNLANYGAKRCLKHKIVSEETKQKLSIVQRQRVNIGAWTNQFGGYKRDRGLLKKEGERRSSAYTNWRNQVWLRDNFKCKIENEDCNGRIEAHHILGWVSHPELRYQINNGITLCHAHHPFKRAEEKRLTPYFTRLVSVSKE